MTKETIKELNKRIEELTLENNKLKEENNILKKNKSKTPKKNKKQNGPKKALSAYIIFYTEELVKYKEQNPGKAIKISTISHDLDLSEKWKKIKKDVEKYSYYMKKHEEDKERYQKEIKVLNN